MLERRTFIAGLSVFPLYLSLHFPYARADEAGGAQVIDQHYGLFIEGAYDVNLSTGKFELISAFRTNKCSSSDAIYNCIAGMEG
ncbi:hypothetical protein [Ruegeria sp. EL01]|jgi:hypothetical protein|uniref:hypothetical protein n=1 Tax=Ruegeria sp. EL01 TaxID=2107578 RepID=UPI000EA804EF|nr:hypothetical protein [Ruegeria sp. EL01]